MAVGCSARVPPGVAKVMLCDHIITYRHTAPHVPMIILQSSRICSEKRESSQIQVLGDSEYHLKIWGGGEVHHYRFPGLHRAWIGNLACRGKMVVQIQIQRWNAEMADRWLLTMLLIPSRPDKQPWKNPRRECTRSLELKR